jgi:hypothetical protein
VFVYVLVMGLCRDAVMWHKSYEAIERRSKARRHNNTRCVCVYLLTEISITSKPWAYMRLNCYFVNWRRAVPMDANDTLLEFSRKIIRIL